MDNQHSNDAKALGHEPIGANVRAVGETGIGLAVVVVVAFLVTAGLMKFYATIDDVSPDAPVSEQVPRSPGFPELNPDQPVELHKLREQEQHLLDGYGWTDRAAGVARIPIAQAMKIIAAEGLPDTPPPADQAPDQGGSKLP